MFGIKNWSIFVSNVLQQFPPPPPYFMVCVSLHCIHLQMPANLQFSSDGRLWFCDSLSCARGVRWDSRHPSELPFIQNNCQTLKWNFNSTYPAWDLSLPALWICWRTVMSSEQPLPSLPPTLPAFFPLLDLHVFLTSSVRQFCFCGFVSGWVFRAEIQGTIHQYLHQTACALILRTSLKCHLFPMATGL